jgi:hypothetical protein
MASTANDRGRVASARETDDSLSEAEVQAEVVRRSRGIER